MSHQSRKALRLATNQLDIILLLLLPEADFTDEEIREAIEEDWGKIQDCRWRNMLKRAKKEQKPK